MQSLNPVLLTAASTRKLPRALLLAMVVAYAFSGLIGRDPWRGDDAQGFGYALSLAQGQNASLGILQVAGLGVAAEGPFWFAIVAAFIKVLFYVPVGLAILLALAALWYAAYYAARTPAAQPLSLALGGQPKPVDYGCAVADGAVLVLLATLGIALKLHELSAQAAQFTLHCVLLLGASMALYKPKPAAWLLAASLAALGLNRGLPALLPALVWVWVLSFHPAWSGLARARWALVGAAAAGLAVNGGVAYFLAGAAYAHALWEWNTASFGFAGWGKWTYFFSNFLAIGWPAVPFAIAAAWRWRRQLRAPHIWLGVSYVWVMVVGVLTQTTISEASFLSVLPGAVIVAAFLLPALPRVWMNALDWFGVMALSFAAALAWLAWLALTTGWPTKLAQNITRLSPNFDASINYLALAIALAMTVFWMFVVRWRVTKPSTVVWRAAVVWSAGMLTVWVLIGSLGMPWLNYGKSYRAVAVQLKTALIDHSQCVSPLRLGLPQRAVLAYFGELSFEPQSADNTLDTTLDTPATVGCNWLLEYDSLQALSSLERLPYLPAGQWKLVWEGRRYTDKDERFRLYQRQK
jgi:hypothetical protein